MTERSHVAPNTDFCCGALSGWRDKQRPDYIHTHQQSEDWQWVVCSEHARMRVPMLMSRPRHTLRHRVIRARQQHAARRLPGPCHRSPQSHSPSCRLPPPHPALSQRLVDHRAGSLAQQPALAGRCGRQTANYVRLISTCAHPLPLHPSEPRKAAAAISSADEMRWMREIVGEGLAVARVWLRLALAHKQPVISPQPGPGTKVWAEPKTRPRHRASIESSSPERVTQRPTKLLPCVLPLGNINMQ